MFSQHHRSGEIIPPNHGAAGRMSFLWASPGGAGTAPPSSVEPMVAAVDTQVLCLQLVEYCWGRLVDCWERLSGYVLSCSLDFVWRLR